jgi:hypothetical protein
MAMSPTAEQLGALIPNQQAARAILSDRRYDVTPQRFDRVDRSITFSMLRIGRQLRLLAAA